MVSQFQSISTLLEESMEEWEIPREKVLIMITDNGSKLVASVEVSVVGAGLQEEGAVESAQERQQDS